MDFRLLRLKWPPLLAVAVLVAVSSLEAQPAATNAWQPIIFSSPSNTDISSNLTPQATQPAAPSSFQSMLRSLQNASPVTTFGNLPAAPMPGQIFILGRAQRLPKSADNNRDWEFMSAAEILGVAPNQILPTPERETSGNQGSLTPIERYFERQNSPTRMRDNLSGNSSLEQNFWAGGGDQTNDAASDLFGNNSGNSQSTIFNPSLNNAPNGNLFAGPNGNSDWSKLFGSLLPSAPTPNLAQQQQQQQQQAEMDQFKQLLDPSFTPVTTATPSSDKTTFPQPQTILSFSDDSTAPLANPIGASFAPLSSGIGKPASLAPLPTITQQASVQPVAPPTWTPQPPPWLSPAPQPFAVPQRKF